MVVQEIEFVDYDGAKRSETHYFNLSESELHRMMLSSSEDLATLLEKIVKEDNREKMIEYFDKIIDMSYGERVGDAKNFFKLDEDGRPLVRKFKQTAAYDALWMKLISDAEFSANFVNGILPKTSVKQQIAAANAPAAETAAANAVAPA